jgi:hypothetical protein
MDDISTTTKHGFFPRFLSNPPGTLFWLLLAFLFGGVFSLWRGPVLDWDAMNYHYYNAWAFLRNPGGVDIFGPAEHAFLSPLVEVPYYLVAYEWFPDSPRLVVFLMGLPFGLLIFLTGLCINKVLLTYKEIGTSLRYFYTFLLSFFGLSGYAVISQVGWRSNEIEISCFVLGGLAVFLHFSERKDGKEKSLFRACVFSGILLGIAPGLKLTALIFTVPFLLGILFYYSTWRERIKAFLLFSTAWWLAFLLVYGWWGWRLWQLTGNPFFPALNNIFHSEWYPAGETLADKNFLPKSLRHALFFPFHMVLDNELRFLVVYCVVGIWISFLFIRREMKRRKFVNIFQNQGKVSRLELFVLVFVGLSYLFWLARFSILRYFVPVTCLTGVVCFICIFSFREKRNVSFCHEINASVLLFFTILSAFPVLLLPYYGKGEILEGIRTMEIPRLYENTLVLVGKGTSFLVPLLDKKNNTSEYIGGLEWAIWEPNPIPLKDIKDCRLKEEIIKKISNHRGPICMFQSHLETPSSSLTSFGIFVDDSLFRRLKIKEDSFILRYAENKHIGVEENLKYKKYFLENVMQDYRHFTHKDSSLFSLGYYVKASRYRRGGEKDYFWLGTGKSVAKLYLKTVENLKNRIAIKGKPHGQQRAVIKVNGREIFSGEVPADGFKGLSIPEGVLQVGANQVEFNWPDARPVGKGDNRVVAFAFEELLLE